MYYNVGKFVVRLLMHVSVNFKQEATLLNIIDGR